MLSLEKHSRPNHVRGFLKVKPFHDDLKLCPVDAIVSYNHKVFDVFILYMQIDNNVIFQVSQLVPGRSTLFVSYCKPHAAVTSKTMSRWVVTLLSAAGVDTSIFKAHASRSAASCFHAKQLSSIDIIKLGDWSASSDVFRKFYERYF